MLNNISIMGRLTTTPELRKTPNDVSVTKFRIANTRNYKNTDGEYKADFFDVTAWRGTADFITKYFSKGELITIEGNLEADEYTDKNGNKRVSVYINASRAHFCSGKNDGSKTDSLNNDTDFIPDFSTESDNEFSACDEFSAFPG